MGRVLRLCEVAAISLSNAIDKPQFDEREKRYHEIRKRYSKEEFDRFPQMFGELTLALEDAFATGGNLDVLGNVFHELELHNKYKGRYFTPYHLCEAMAKMTIGSKADMERMIAERGYIGATEPACGSGAMVIALAMAMKEEGVNPQQFLHITATDLDARCCHVAYIQLSLLHIPAIVQHGNTLTLEEFGRWHTPAHILGGWSWKTWRSPANALLAPAARATDTDVGHTTQPAEKLEDATPPAPPPVPAEEPARSLTFAEKEKAKRQKPQQLTLF